MNRHATALALAVALTVMASALAGCSSTHAPAPAGDGAHAMATPTSPSTSPSTSSEGSATPTSEAGAPMDADPTLDALPMWDAPAEASALSRAEGFVRAWARPDLDATTWLTGVNGYLSASAAEKFRWTDPSLIPATTVTAAPQVTGQPSGTSVTVLVPTDAGAQLVLLIRPDAATPWVVSTLTRADAAAASR